MKMTFVPFIIFLSKLLEYYRTFRIGRFGRSCLGWHAIGTLVGVILLASLIKTR